MCSKYRELRPKYRSPREIDFIYDTGIFTLLQTYVQDMGLPLGQSMEGELLGTRRMWRVIFSKNSHTIIYPIPILQCDVAIPPSRGRGLYSPPLNVDR